MYIPYECSEELYHHGILGQKWGLRRYQNPDGSLTEAGRVRYGSVENLRKIQDARADAKAYKIRTKAKLKATKKYNKEQEKIARKEQKKAEKRSLKEYERYAKKKEAIDKKYQNDFKKKNNSAAKAMIKEFAREAIWPNVKYNGKKIIGAYMDEMLSSPSQKEQKKWEKETKRNEARYRRDQSRIMADYYDTMANKEPNWSDIRDDSFDMNGYRNRTNTMNQIYKNKLGNGKIKG